MTLCNSTVPLRHVMVFLHLGLLRGLRPVHGIGRKLTDSIPGELGTVPKFI